MSLRSFILTSVKSSQWVQPMPIPGKFMPSRSVTGSPKNGQREKIHCPLSAQMMHGCLKKPFSVYYKTHTLHASQIANYLLSSESIGREKSSHRRKELSELQRPPGQELRFSLTMTRNLMDSIYPWGCGWQCHEHILLCMEDSHPLLHPWCSGWTSHQEDKTLSRGLHPHDSQSWSSHQVLCSLNCCAALVVWALKLLRSCFGPLNCFARVLGP